MARLPMPASRASVRLLTLVAMAAAAFAYSPPAAFSAPFSECPAIGASASCRILIVIDPDRTVSIHGDPTVGPYDGADDTLVGVRNDSASPVDAITVSGDQPIGAFDADGLCSASGAPSGCPFGPTGYEGPGTTLTVDPSDLTKVEVDFDGALAPGAEAYFSLEESVTAANLTARRGKLIEDADGDALPDSWEDSPGRDLGGGLFDNNLHAAGASSQHKDIFVLEAAEKGAELSAAAKRLVTQAFALAPVSNPDGTTGIRLHFVKGPTLTPQQSDAFRQPNGFPDGRSIVEFFGNDLEFHAYHYVISTLWNTRKYAGIADIPGQFIVLDNCGARTVPGYFGLGTKARKSCSATDADQAANVMHELGHNLGLHHGGGAPLTGRDLEDPYKPNFLSVMSYSFSHGGVPGIGVDYSRWGPDDLNILDERSLAENDGVFSTNPLNPVPSGAKTKYYCPANGSTRTVAIGKPSNWNCSKGIDSGRVSANIDQPADERTPDPEFPFLSDTMILSPHDDWANLLFGGGVIGQATGAYPGGPFVANGRMASEPSVQLRDQLGAELDPVPPTPRPTVVAQDASTLTVQVPVTTWTTASITWAPVLADGSLGDVTAVASVPAGTNRPVRFVVPRSRLTDAVGVASTVTNTDWTVTDALRLSP